MATFYLKSIVTLTNCAFCCVAIFKKVKVPDKHDFISCGAETARVEENQTVLIVLLY